MSRVGIHQVIGGQRVRRGRSPVTVGADPAIVAPTSFMVTPTAAGLYVDWNDVAAPGGNFGRYEYRVGTANPPAGAWVSTGFTSTANITSLTPGASYFVQVRSVTTGNLDGTPSTVQGPFVPLAVTDAPEIPEGDRDWYEWPGASTSIWTLPAVTGPVLEPETSGTTESLRWETTASNGGFWVNGDPQYSHPMYKATLADPVVTITDRNGGSARSIPSSAGIRIGPDMAIANGSDRHLHVMQPDGRTMLELIGVVRESSTQYNVSRCALVDYKGSLIGPLDNRGIGGNGTRAYGGSAGAGLIREHEVDAVLDYRDNGGSTAGLIPHALSLALRPNQLLWFSNPIDGNYEYLRGGVITEANSYLYPGWPIGTSLKGFFSAGGKRWPASEQDYTSRYQASDGNSYSGQLTSTPGTGVPMGSFVCIPGSVNIDATLGNWAERAIARAFQDYGGYVTDRAGDAGLYVEVGANTALRSQLIAQNAISLRRVWRLLRVVNVSDHANPGGGPLAAPRRRPLAPEIGA